MLKRLELVGFKSFAEKTHFDFAPGLTAIVGPNGSGKSNLVDAVRWILGEQSAKSLRGGEMADVIFNGSTSRRSFGMAEVTMTLDNRRRSLATEADEVQITRRVYRDGEGEYLINHQVCRLRDIKDLFLGSGAGTDAYCVIEQGRVDVLLQASTKERRVLFEEAAGTSRFKAKKTETLRKLERVDQNLQRVRDIIDEVEKQLRSVKLQAAKAQRYQEYSGRLRELRVGLGLREYHELTGRLADEQTVLDRLRAGLAERTAQAEAWEADTRRLEAALAQLDDAAREQEARLAHARQQIAAAEATLGHERALSADLEADLARTRAGLTEQAARVAALAEAAARAAAELRGVEAQCQDQRLGVHTLEDELQAIVRRLDDLHKQIQDDKDEHLEQMRRAAHLQNDAVSLKAHVDNLRRERERLRQRSEQTAEHLASLDLELQELTRADEALQARLATARQALADQRQEGERLRQLRDETGQCVADLRAQRSGLASRIEVLEGLERSHEGLGTGVREVFALLAEERGSPADAPRAPGPALSDVVVGLVADLLTVRREYAPLLDLALGERAQRFLVRDAGLLAEALTRRSQPFAGRVSFLPLAPAAPANGPARPNRLIEVSPLGRVRMPQSPEGGPAHPGVVAPAEQLVTCDDPELADLPAQLLGRTLIVRDLAAARTLAAHTSGYRFVTLQGELLEADGTLTVGTHHAEAGILSRKSELRELRGQVAGLDRRTAEAERDLADLRERIAALDTRVGILQEEVEVLSEQATDLRSRLGQHRQRREGLHEEMALSRSEIRGLEQEIHDQEQAWQQARAEAEAAERQVQALQARVTSADQEVRALEQQRQRRQQDCTAAKVALAQVEERWTALQARHRQTEADWQQRGQERDQAHQHLAGVRSRLDDSQRLMLQASAALAQWYLDKEAAERQTAELARARDGYRHERQALAQRALAARNDWRAEQEQAHAHELQAHDLRHRRDTLAERLREDYQIDLEDLYQLQMADRRLQMENGDQPPSPESPGPAERPAGNRQAASGKRQALDPEAAHEEIAELRRKLNRLGSVNLDSLQELADLEARAHTLQTQFDDLNAAKRSLEEIIAKINEDSRRLFTETFTAIRAHFQELFRKLFGGGMADIVLEDETDILECGIEINARPPGKELRSISLMSGGEKTLTAVALLLGIFRSKPSPFCILDEVDAALDEANIGRFTAVLREFLDQSQFILVTHSKRTMAAADVLYGITMQESGVSKQVAVRFEDWPDDGTPAAAEPAEVVRNGHEGS
jgi:chromosome segregation protein